MACLLTINGQGVPLHDLTPQHEEAVDGVRTWDGSYRQTRRWTKRSWQCKSTTLTRADANNLISLVRNGELSVSGEAITPPATCFGSLDGQGEEPIRLALGVHYRVNFVLREA